MRFRLKSAHYFPGDRWLPGDTELGDKGEAAGTLVGDNTPYPICALSDPREGAMFPTVEMEPLDDEAREALEEEETRLSQARIESNNPREQPDDYDTRYVPGFKIKRPTT